MLEASVPFEKMDTFPTEIYSKICAYACTDDDGFTGASLLSVSHYIRQIAKPHAFHSVALMDSRQIMTFAELVRRNPGFVKGVRHLFICDEQEESEEAEGGLFRQHFVNFTNRYIPGARKQRLKKKARAFKRATKHTFHLISQILLHVSPTLVTLKLCITSRFRTLPFANHRCGECRLPRLPVLEELVMDYRVHPQHIPLDCVFLCSDKYSDEEAPLPSLKYLDISTIRMPHEHPYVLYAHVASIAPNLTHLCLPSTMTYPVLIALRGSIVHTDHDIFLNEEDRERYMLPVTLKRVSIPLDVDHGPGMVGELQVNQCLRCFLGALGNADGRIRVCRSKKGDCKGLGVEESFYEWVNRESVPW